MICKGERIMSEDSNMPQEIKLDQKTIEVLVASIIPTSKYFESRFDHLQYQVDELKAGQKNLLDVMERRFTTMQSDIDKRFTTMQSDNDKRFSDIDKRFTTMQSDIDKRFSDIDKRFTTMQSDIDKRFSDIDNRFVSLQNTMDKRFEQIDDKLDKILERIDRRIDNGLRENRAQSMRLFTFAMTFSAISMIGLVGKMLQLF
jgi:DNA repair exonuclease SbcCD ATPase subunit